MLSEHGRKMDAGKKPRILIYCQHVLGMGHLVRTMAIARALRHCTVLFVNGGEALTGVEIPEWVTIANLPPLTSDSEFQTLKVHSHGTTLEQVQQVRKHRLFEVFNQFHPDVMLIELFPFGRKQFAFELLPLLAHIRLSAPWTKVVCSLRDILVTKPDQTRHEDWVVSLMNRYFDLLLIHSDPTFQTLNETFSRCSDLRCDVQYTGFVSPQSDGVADTPETDQESDTNNIPLVLASVGGGRVGYELLDSSIRASALLIQNIPHRMTLFTGPYMPDPQYAQLQELAAPHAHIDVHRFTSTFESLMGQAALSISMAGYNTCMNILNTGTQALVFPFTGHKNDEQTIRAKKLERRGLLDVLEQDDLMPHRLAAKITSRLVGTHNTSKHSINTEGGQHTALAITRLALTARSYPLQINGTLSAPAINRPEPWLSALRQFLESKREEGRSLHLFLRDDDIDEAEEPLQQLLDLSLARNVPMNLEIIPGRLTTGAISILKNTLRADHSLLSLNQHGWMHTNHESHGRKCEFGPTRSFTQQHEDIARGKALLEATFEEQFYPAFTPPWNRCTAETYQVLDELGFWVFSKDQGNAPLTGYGFTEISTTLDLYTWKGGARMKAPHEIGRSLIAQLDTLPLVGLLLHHKVMDSEAFTFLDQLLHELRRCPFVQFHTFRTLYPLALPSQMVPQ